MSTPEEQLVERLQRGDREALAELLSDRSAPLMGYIERQLGVALRRKIEPDDIYQEVAAEAVRSLDGLDFGGRDPFGWLCRIAERRIIDAHRRFFGAQKRNAAREVPLQRSGAGETRAGVINLLVASMTSASKQFSRQQREFRVAEALEKLPETQREALRLRYVEGLPSKEIAARLGKTDGAIRVMLTRSLGKLQSILGPEIETS